MRVIVTRPDSEARGWLEDLRHRGFEPVSLPLIAIVPVADPAGLAAQWRTLDQLRAVMFVSGNAVRNFFMHRPAGMPWPPQTRAWAPGDGTRAALLSAGVPGALVDSPPAQSEQFDSETLWQQVGSQVAPGDRVLIVRGGDAPGQGNGRDWLAEQLAKAGARVMAVAAYLRRAPHFDDAALKQARQSSGDGSVWLFSSSQAIGHLQALMPDQDWSAASAVATHARIAKAARRAGFGVVCESRPALDAVVAALESFR